MLFVLYGFIFVITLVCLKNSDRNFDGCLPLSRIRVILIFLTRQRPLPDHHNLLINFNSQFIGQLH